MPIIRISPDEQVRYDSEPYCYWDMDPLAINFHGSCGAESGTDPKVLRKIGPCEKCGREIRVFDRDGLKRWADEILGRC